MKHYLCDFDLTLDLEIEATWRKGYSGARERGSGIQLEPDEPAGWEITSVKWKNIEISDALDEHDLERIAEQLEEGQHD